MRKTEEKINKILLEYQPPADNLKRWLSIRKSPFSYGKDFKFPGFFPYYDEKAYRRDIIAFAIVLILEFIGGGILLKLFHYAPYVILLIGGGILLDLVLTRWFLLPALSEFTINKNLALIYKNCLTGYSQVRKKKIHLYVLYWIGSIGICFIALIKIWAYLDHNYYRINDIVDVLIILLYVAIGVIHFTCTKYFFSFLRFNKAMKDSINDQYKINTNISTKYSLDVLEDFFNKNNKFNFNFQNIFKEIRKVELPKDKHSFIISDDFQAILADKNRYNEIILELKPYGVIEDKQLKAISIELQTTSDIHSKAFIALIILKYQFSCININL